MRVGLELDVGLEHQNPAMPAPTATAASGDATTADTAAATFDPATDTATSSRPTR